MWSKVRRVLRTVIGAWADEAHIDTRIEAGDPLAAVDAIRDAAQRLLDAADELERVLTG